MEKKNMVLLTVIAIATLLVAVVGATFAYFTATVNDDRSSGEEHGEAKVGTQTIQNSLIIEKSKEGFGKFDDQNVYPGHKELLQLKITSPKGNATDTYFNIVYEGTNTFPKDTIKFQIYESTDDLEPGFGADKDAFKCEKISEKDDTDSNFKLYEKCELDETLHINDAHPVLTQPVSTSNYGEADGNGSTSQKTVLNGDLPFVITGNADKKTMYYYVVVEYVNNASMAQNEEIGKKLEGKITVEPAAKNPGAIKDTDEEKLSEKTE